MKQKPFLRSNNTIKNTIRKCQRKIDNHQESLKEIEDSLSFQIEQILKQMCCYISIKKIIEQITYNFKDVQFKEFKELLVKILSSLSHMTGVLNSAKGLLENEIGKSKLWLSHSLVVPFIFYPLQD